MFRIVRTGTAAAVISIMCAGTATSNVRAQGSLRVASDEANSSSTISTQEAYSRDGDVGENPQDEFDIFDRPVMEQSKAPMTSSAQLSPQAMELTTELGLDPSLKRLKQLHIAYLTHKTTASQLNALILQFRISRALQRASLQMQDTFANIDGDLAQTNMLLAYASTRRERSLLLTNVATFTGSGTFGILDASTRLGNLSPTSDIFGILGNTTAVLLPLLSLKTAKYSNPRRNQPRLNMLAPFFEVGATGDGYAAPVWHYLNSVPPGSKTSSRTRRDLLVESWKAYRSFGKESGEKKRETIREIVEAPSKTEKLTIEALKTRAELLIDVRALIQSMYRSLAEIDAAISVI